MLISKPFRSNPEKRETIPSEMENFPFLCHWTELDWYEDKTIPWHWHTEFEINCIEDGELTVHSSDQTVTVRKGEAVFVNSGVLHTCFSADSQPCRYYTHIFDMHFLSGMYNSVFEEKYFLPVSRNSSLQLWKIVPETLPRIEMIAAIMQSIELCREEPGGYEFNLRSRMCDFWQLLLADTEEFRSSTPLKNNADSDRMKAMMSFIRDHCSEKLTLKNIADAANISTRECTRCFRRSIDLSPNEYLNQSRIRLAARLLEESDLSILEISEESGFSSASYFSKMFRDTMGVTPKEYRETNQ
jgi:AraC-like DNA-binding protein